MHKHKHKSKPHPWGPWSEWAWDENHGRWYRVRQDLNGSRALSRANPLALTPVAGNVDYEWDNRQTPREVEELTQDFRNLSPGSSYDAQGMSQA